MGALRELSSTRYDSNYHYNVTSIEGEINYALEMNRVYVHGKFLGEKSHDQHRHLLDQIECHLERSNQLVVHFTYDLFDTSTLAYLFKVIKVMNKANKKDKETKIVWQYSTNEEMLDVGMDLAEFCDFQMAIVNN